MLQKVIYLLVAAAAGWLLTWLHMPAGWLIGALLTGVIYRLWVGNLVFHPLVFLFAFGLIGVNIGLTMKMTMFAEVASVLLPLIAGLVAMLLGSWWLSRILFRYSSLDGKTALFCCIPGGASVMMLLSKEYGADQRMVAAFQSSRVVLLVLSIPVFAGMIAGIMHDGGGQTETAAMSDPVTAAVFPGFKILCIAALIAAALGLAKVLKIPAAPFLYAMLLAFLFNQFVVPIGAMPNMVVGLGQVLLGAIIGLGFDRTALARLKEIGWLSIGILLLFLVLSFFVSLIFFLLTSLDYTTSLLSMVPGGAPQMSSTASLLDLDSTMVASVQLVRLLIIFLLLPVIIPYVMKKPSATKSS